MLDAVAPIRGRKGGGKGGGSSRAPYEAPDNLLADSTAYIMDVVSEGEIEGWADADNPAKCIYFDDTPLQNADGSYNFEGVEYWLRTGTPDQEPVPGFSAVENEVNVGVEVTESQSVARSVAAADVDAVRVKVGVGQLTTLDPESGDLTGASVSFAIDMAAGSGGWEEVGAYTISGKTTSGYQRAYRIELPDVRPVSLRVRRTTPDSDTSKVQDVIYFVSYTEIIDAKLRYPDTAYVALAIPAQAFGGRVPRRSYRLKGMKCWVPSNYDPVARTYDESSIWDGTFQLAYTDNPAFFTYTVFLENRWGLGERIAPDLVDKWRIYQIGKYCDGLVDDGLGGQEPRFTMNGVMNTREAAYQVITQLSAAFRGVTYWGAGAVVPVQDAPSDPVKIVTNANVVDGAFNYAGTGLPARKTAVVASYRDQTDHFKVKAGVVFEDSDAIQRYGRRQSDITLPFQTSRGGALREAKWIVDTNTTQRETVNYQAGFDHAALRPGDKILISDKHRVGFRMGGRVLSISADRREVEVDAPVLLQSGETHTLLIANDVGDFIEADVSGSDAGGDGMANALTLSAPLAANIQQGTVFMLTASNLPPRQFRVVSNTPEKHLFNIVALEDDPNKHARVEQGIRVDDDAPYILPDAGRPQPPQNLSVEVYFREVPAGLVASVSWERAGASPIAAYRLELTDANGVRSHVRDLPAQSFDIPLSGTEASAMTVHVAAENHLGLRSDFANASFTVQDVLRVPDNVEDFRIRVLGDQAHLTWAKGKPTVSHYHIKHLPPGAPGGWNEAVDIERDIPTRTATVPALPGRYLIKAVSIFGEYSPDATVAQSNITALSGYNVVREVALHPEFAGLLEPGLYRTERGVQLLSDSPWADWPTWAETGIWAYQGNVADGAVFTSSDVTDLGASMTSRVTATVDGYGLDLGEWWSDWGLWSDVGLWAGDVDGTWRIRLQVSTTEDDPAGSAPVWSEWSDLLAGDYLARAFRFRVIFASSDVKVSAVLRALSVQIDVPDRIVEGADLTCPAAGIYVPFAPPFLEKPAIAVDGQGLPVGVRSVRTGADAAGFHQRFVDDQGNGVACTFDYIAKGYGRLA
jgi:hypothetical protein